jgi:hypothetical protein
MRNGAEVAPPKQIGGIAIAELQSTNVSEIAGFVPNR